MCRRIKKSIMLLWVCVILFTLVACNKKGENEDNVATTTDATNTTEITEELEVDKIENIEAIDFEISADISSINMKVGDSKKVNITVKPENEDYDLVWSVDYIGIVAISDGEIKAISSGECQINVKLKGTDKSVNIKVIVEAEVEDTEEANKDFDDNKEQNDNSNSSGDTASNNNGSGSESNADSNSTNENNSGTGNNSNSGNNSNTGNNSNSGNSSNTGSNSNNNENNSNTGNNSNSNSNSGNGNNSNNSNNTTSTTEATTESTTTEAQEEGYYIDYAASVLALVNAERENVGVAPLTLDYSLMAAANVRSKECAESFSHTRPNGSSCFTAISEAGVGYGACGENIAAGYWSAESVVQGWVNSPGHYANMISASYTRMAVSCYYDPNSDYGCYWAQLFIN